MKLKTLLLGSAAAMIAVSGARAADAVIAEPEPVDYVKVCDMYGAGFFYIPGTETCLKINGYVDVQYEYTARNNLVANRFLGLTHPHISRASIGEPVYLARVNFDAREETDWGTLQSYIRLEGSGGNAGGGGITAKDVYLSLGGFSAGYRTVATETGGLPGVVLDGYYGGGRHWYVDYTYAANGFSATAGVSLDNNRRLIFGANVPGIGGINGGAIVTTGNLFGGSAGKSVDPYIVASYTGSMWTIRGKYHHDTSAENGFYGVDGSVTPWDGVTIRGYWEGANGFNSLSSGTGLCSNVGLAGSSVVTATGASVTCAAAFGGRNAFQAEQAWGVGASWDVMDNVSLAVGYATQVFNKDYARAAVLGGGVNALGIRIPDEQSFVVGIDWNPVDNLVVRTNYRRTEWGQSETDEIRVRVRRSF